jgi:hypothetical protein
LSARGWPQARPMDRIESFLADVFALAGEDTNAVRAGVRDALAIDLLGAADEQAHEGQCRSRLPRAVPRSRRRGNASTPRNADRRALTTSTGRCIEGAR